MLESQGHDKVPNLYWIPGTCENVIDATMESKDQQKGIRVSYTFRRQPQSRPITAWSSGSVKSTPIWLAASGTGIQPNVYISCFLPSHHWTQKKELKDFRFSQNAFAPWEPLSLLESHRKIGKTCLAVCCLLIWFTIVLQFPGRFRRLLLGLCLLVSYPPSDSSKHHRGRIIPIYIKQKKTYWHLLFVGWFLSCCHLCHFLLFLLLSLFRYRCGLVLMLSHLRLSFLPLLRPWFWGAGNAGSRRSCLPRFPQWPHEGSMQLVKHPLSTIGKALKLWFLVGAQGVKYHYHFVF